MKFFFRKKMVGLLKTPERNLEFFNTLSFTLEVQPSEEGGPTRVRVPRDYIQIWDGDDFQPIVPSDWDRVVWTVGREGVELNCTTGDTGVVYDKTYVPLDSVAFTMRELIDVIEDFETGARQPGVTDWLGEVDESHTFFEGIHFRNGMWVISWGS